MTKSSKRPDAGRGNAVPVDAGKWWPGPAGHETGDQVRVGMEKIIADLPEPTGMALMMMQDSTVSLPADVALREKLQRRIASMAKCGKDGMAREVRHTSCGRPNAYLPVVVFFCHEPGCPKCWNRRVAGDLDKHRDRFRVALGDGYRMFRLDAPTGWGPTDTRDALTTLLRRRTINPHLKPFAGAWLPVIFDGQVRYSITLIVHPDFPADTVASFWSEITGGQASIMDQPTYEADEATMDLHRRIGDFDALGIEGEWEPHPVDSSETLHALKMAADQAIPLLVASGHLNPDVAATWMIEETKRRKLKFGGGFQDAAPVFVRVDTHDEANTAHDPTNGSETPSRYRDDEYDEALFDGDACPESPRDRVLELGETRHAEDDEYDDKPAIPCPYDPACELVFTGRAIDIDTLTEMGYEMTEIDDRLRLWERKERSRPLVG